MTDLSVTAANVKGDSAAKEWGTAGEAITAGQAVYLDTPTRTYKLADANSATAAARQARGIALNGAAAGQPLAIATSGDVTAGAALTAGTAYYLSAAAAGGIAPIEDLTTGDYVCLLGLAKSATVLALDIQFPGVSL
jgi:hypothetical protein